MMTSKTQATIYLSNQRGCSQEDWFRSFHVFNYGKYFNENRTPFGSLNTLNENTLKGGRTISRLAKEDATVLILPIVGALKYSTPTHKEGMVDAGEVAILSVVKDSVMEMMNPYEDELINFLEVWYTHPAGYPIEPVKIELDLEQNKNSVIPLAVLEGGKQHIAPYIGKFKGREEGIYTPKNSANGVFVFIVEGAFEVANRLLHARDGLALWNVEQVEFEALSNDAIIFLLEVAL
jgi:redox-sensitive bicupin YhaK (pirin superfamily)